MNMTLRTRKSVIPGTCRICLKVDTSNGVLIGSEGTWFELFEYCFGIHITLEDACKRLCDECAYKISDISKFKKLALRSNELWQSTIKVSFNSSKISTHEKNNTVKHEYIKQSTKKYFPKEQSDADLDTEILQVENHGDSKNKKQIILENVPQNDTTEDIADESFEVNNDIRDDIEDENLKPQNETIEEIKNDYFEEKGLFSKCQICKKSFRTKLLLKNHLIKKRCKIPNGKGYYCGLCDTTLADEEKLKQHVTGHGLDNELSCKLCAYIGRDFADMTMHRYNHMPKECIKTIMCHLFVCNKKFNVLLALQYHYRVAHLKKSGGLCSVCNKEFISYKAWRNHEKLHKSNNFICDMCGKKFLYKHAIINHMELHSDYKHYICHCCGRGFKRHGNLKLHLLTTHDNSKAKCKHCNYVFKNQKTLEWHLRKITSETRHPCKDCSKSFPTAYLLKRHMIWHNDERPCVCNICGLSYKAAGQLRIHMRKHTGEMPYKCEYCNRCFPSSNQLKVHVAVHTGQRRNKCSFCPRSFHGKKMLLEHCAKVHSGMEARKEDGEIPTESDTEKQLDLQKQSC